MSLLPDDDDDDRAWAEKLGAMPRSIEPHRDLWPDLTRAMHARARARRVRRLTWGVTGALAVAAAVALVIGVVRHDGGRRDAVAVRDGLHERDRSAAAAARPDPDGAEGLLAEEPAYRAAIAELDEALAARENGLSPDAALAVNTQVAALDAAIAEARAALEAQPQDPELQEQLRDEYQHEIDVLSDVIDLTTRT